MDWGVTVEAIFKRRSIRKFTGESIAQEDVRKILQAGMAAPSAKNNQDWVFILIDSGEDIEEFIRVHPNAFAMRTAALNILVCADKTKNLDPELEWGVFNACAAMENMLIMAAGLGYGSLWVGVSPDPKRIDCMRRICVLPEYITPVGLVCVGRAAKEKEPIDRYLEDAVFRGRYAER